MLAGFLFSAATLVDCSFVKVDIAGQLPVLGESELLPDVVRELGLVTFAKKDGECYFYNVGDGADQIEWYVTQFTSDWDLARTFAGLGVAMGFFVLLYCVTFMCTAQVKPVRLILGVICQVVLVAFQGLVFLLFGSDFCDERGCSFSRTAGASIASACCYSIAGMAFLSMKDYPGEPPKGKKEEIVEDEKVEEG